MSSLVQDEEEKHIPAVGIDPAVTADITEGISCLGTGGGFASLAISQTSPTGRLGVSFAAASTTCILAFAIRARFSVIFSLTLILDVTS
jgi:hypothetical protein